MKTIEEVRAAVETFRGLVNLDTELPVLHRLASSLKPGQVYFEIGTCGGRSALIAALSARDDVEIWTIDIACRDNADEHVKCIQIVHTRFASLGVLHKARFCPLSSAEMPWDGKPIDVLFIDGNHSPAGVEADVDKWSPFVPPSGKIAFHDAVRGVRAYKGVLIQVERLLDSGDWEEETGGGSTVVLRRK